MKGKHLTTLTGHTEGLESLVFSPDGKYLALGTGRSASLYDVMTGREELKFEGGSQITFSPDGLTLATAVRFPRKGHFGSVTMPIRLWSLATGKELHSWENRETSQLIFSPDGRTLLAFEGFQGGRLLDTVTGNEVFRFKVPLSNKSFAFSPSGRFFAIGGKGTIQLWEVFSGKETCKIESPQGVVTALAFSPDSRTLAASGADSTILLWDVAGQLK